MRKIGLILAVLLCFSGFSSNLFATPFDNVYMVSEVEEYDSGDFPTKMRHSYMLAVSKPLSDEQVTIDSVPTGNNITLSPLAGWDLWAKSFSMTPIGNSWATIYTFRSGTDTATLNLSNCTFRVLAVPQNVTINGNTISWDPVEYANLYRLRWFPLNGNGNPDTVSSPLGDTGLFDSPSYTMTHPVSGKYALKVEALGFCGGGEFWVNRSSFYLEHVIEDDYDYYLPYYSSVNNYWTGLGLANRNQEYPTDLQVIVYDSNGNLLAIENKTIPAYGQDAFPVATQLNTSGWMKVSSFQPLSGLAFLGSGGTPSLMADIPFISELSSCLVIPHIAQDDTWDTSILICNPNNETISVTLRYVDKAGIERGIQNYTIPAFGSGEYFLSTVFSDKIPLAGRVEIDSSRGIAAFALYSDSKNGGTYYAGINAESCE